VGDFGEISWMLDIAMTPSKIFSDPDRPLEDYLPFSGEGFIGPECFREAATIFQDQINHFQKEYQKFIDAIANIPLIVAFTIWLKEARDHYPECDEIAKDLYLKDFLGTLADEGGTWTLAHARYFDDTKVINAIRCSNELTFRKKEKLVHGYITMINWISNKTYGYIKRISDPDLLRSADRALIYPEFINFLEVLKEKERLVAKLLYFGGSRTLEEVLQLSLENVDFENRQIKYENSLIHYPEHVFNDIKLLTSSRTSGRVFLGRQDAPLNPATIFRNFKEAAQKIELDQNFSPKTLTTNK